MRRHKKNSPRVPMLLIRPMVESFILLQLRHESLQTCNEHFENRRFALTNTLISATNPPRSVIAILHDIAI